MFSSKKAQARVPKAINSLLGLVVLAGGILPLLAQFGVIGELPQIPGLVIEILLALGGLVLLFDAMIGSGSMTQTIPRNVNVFAAIIVLAGGATTLLSRFGVIGTLPEIPRIVFYILLSLGGLILVLDGLLGAKNTSI